MGVGRRRRGKLERPCAVKRSPAALWELGLNEAGDTKEAKPRASAFYAVRGGREVWPA